MSGKSLHKFVWFSKFADVVSKRYIQTTLLDNDNMGFLDSVGHWRLTSIFADCCSTWMTSMIVLLVVVVINFINIAFIPVFVLSNIIEIPLRRVTNAYDGAQVLSRCFMYILTLLDLVMIVSLAIQRCSSSLHFPGFLCSVAHLYSTRHLRRVFARRVRASENGFKLVHKSHHIAVR